MHMAAHSSSFHSFNQTMNIPLTKLHVYIEYRAECIYVNTYADN